MKLSQCLPKIEESDLQILKKFVVLMNNRQNSVGSVNEARIALFAQKQRLYDLIPPIQGAVKEQAK